LLKGTDLRQIGNGTVSGTGLYQVAGFKPLAVIGCMELAKGAAGPLLAGRGRPILGAATGAAAMIGHNWSPFLGGAGGRGVAVALGASMPLAPEATVLLGAGLGIGRLAGETALGCLVATVAMPAMLAWRRGRVGLWTGLALSAPMLAKRLAGNSRYGGRDRRSVYLNRLLFDRDNRSR
jgi:glycerol-3-phosphate acyltransferase PlsY